MSALVFLHGFVGHADSWQPVLQLLSPNQRTLLPLLLGHQRAPQPLTLDSEQLDPATSFQREVARLAELIAAAQLTDVHLVGYSLGARLALGLLTQHPKLFARATLIGVNPGLSHDDIAGRAERIATDEAWAQLLLTQGLAAFLQKWQAQPLFASQARLPTLVLQQQQSARQHHYPQGLALALRALGLGHMPDFWPLLPQVRQPVQLVVGALDDKFVSLAKKAQTVLPSASLHVVPDVGHNAVLEAPAAVAALLTKNRQQ